MFSCTIQLSPLAVVLTMSDSHRHCDAACSLLEKFTLTDGD